MIGTSVRVAADLTAAGASQLCVVALKTVGTNVQLVGSALPVYPSAQWASAAFAAPWSSAENCTGVMTTPEAGGATFTKTLSQGLNSTGQGSSLWVGAVESVQPTASQLAFAQALTYKLVARWVN